jgi:alcohol dehydrogenase
MSEVTDRLEPVDCELPTRVVFGPGSLSRLGAIAAAEGALRVLCVSDAGLREAGHLRRAREALESAGLFVRVFDDIRENPTDLDVEAGLALARAGRVDAFVALGGGSAMDCAKGINLLYSCGGRVRDYLGRGKATAPLRPMIAAPSTAGTGSEVQSFALISDSQTHQKMACGDRGAAPRVALLDPEITMTMPHAVTAATGLDALSHAVETFVTSARSSVSRRLSRRAWELLSGSFPQVLRSGGDLDARSRMLLGASVAGAAIEHSMLGAAHSAANPLTAHHDVVHGLAVGLTLPHVVRFNSRVAEEDYRELLALGGWAPGAGESAGETLARWLEGILEMTGLPRRLREVGVASDECLALSEEAARQWTAQFNPRPVSALDFLEIYRGAL